MKLLLSAILSACLSMAQGTLSLSNAGTPPQGGYSPGAVVTLNVTAAANDPALSGIQFSYAMPPGVASIAWAAGPAATAASKAISCVSAPHFDCLLVGFNQTPIGNGVVAVATVTLASSVPTSTVALSIGSPVEGSTAGVTLPVNIPNPTVSLSMSNPCAVTGDAAVSAADLSAMVGQALGGANNPSFDLNKDGLVDVLDALIVAAAGTPPNFLCSAK